MGAFDQVASPVMDAPNSPFSAVASAVVQPDAGQPTAAPGFLDRVKADLGKREQMRQDILNAQKKGEQGAIESGYQQAGKVGAGAINDVIGEGLKSAGSEIAAVTPPSIKQPVEDVYNTVRNSGPARYLADKAGEVSQGYSSFQQNNPRFARNVEALADIGSVITGGGISKGAADVAATVADAAKRGATALAEVPRSSMQLAAENAAKDAKQILTPQQYKAKFVDPQFEKMRAAGGALNADATDKAITSAISDLKRNPKISTDAADDMAQAMKEGEGKKVTTDANGNEITTYKVQPWSGDKTDIDTLQAKDVELNSEIRKAHIAGDNNLARKYSIIQDALRDARDNAKPGDIEGGVTGFNAWKMGNHHFGIQSDLQKIDDIVNYTKNMAQPANSLGTRFNMMINRRGKIAGWTPNEIALAKQIAEGSPKQELLRSAAGRLNNGIGAAVGAGAGAMLGGGPIGEVVGGIVGGTATHFGTKMARDAAWSMKMKQVEELKRMILSRQPPELLKDAAEEAAPPALTVKEIMSQKPADAMAIINKSRTAK